MSTLLRVLRRHRVVCDECGRGQEACEWCEGQTRRDWQAICDCGLADFGAHLVECRDRDAFRYVVAESYETAGIPRG